MRTRGERILIGVVVVSVVLAAAAIVVGSRIRSPEQAAADAAPPERTLITAPIERRTLVQTIVTRANVTIGDRISIPPPSTVSAAAITTGPTVAVGDRIDDFGVVAEIEGRPIVVVVGDFDAYRTMSPGDSGPDISQLNDALGRFGCDAPQEDRYTTATAACVGDVYETLGYEPVLAGMDRLARAAADVDRVETELASLNVAGAGGMRTSEILSANSAVNSAIRARDDAVFRKNESVALAERDVDAARDALEVARDDRLPTADVVALERALLESETRLVQTTRSADNEIAALGEALDIAKANVVELQKRSSPAAGDEQRRLRAELESLRRERDTALSLSGATVPAGEIVFVRSLPATVLETRTPVGVDAIEPAADSEFQAEPSSDGAIAVVSASTAQVATAVGARDADLLRPGIQATLLDEVSGEEIEGTIVSIGEATVVDDVAVAVDWDTPIPSWMVGRNVRVTYLASASAGDELAVPVAAILSAAGGQPAVEVVAGDGSTSLVTVDLGRSADGFVAVSADALQEDDLVVVGR